MIAAVRERAPNHLQALQISSMLTARCHRLREEIRPTGGTVYEVLEIIRLLKKAKVKFVLMGTHGIVGWRSESRATHDVDILASASDYEKAIAAIHQAFPELEMVDWHAVTRFKDKTTDQFVIDIMRPVDDLFKAAFRCTVLVKRSHRIPDLEMAIVSKFAAMISPRRKHAKRFVDAGDFVDMIEHNQDEIDLPKLKRLAEKVYKGGGREILKMVADIKAGREIKI